MARRLFRVTKEFIARIPGKSGGKQLIKVGDELWADANQTGDTTIFFIDNIDFEVDTEIFRNSAQLKR